MPPFTGVAVKVTELPEQTGLFEAEIVMLTGRFGLTDTGYWMLDAGLFDVQLSDDVRTHETRSPSTGI